MSRFADLLLRHNRLVVVCWLMVAVAGALTSGAVTGRLSSDLESVPDRPGYEANQAILRAYGTGGQHPFVPVITLPQGGSADAERARLADAFAAAERALDARVVSYPATGDRRFVSADGRTTFGLIYTGRHGGMHAPDFSGQIAAAMRGALPRGAVLRVTGIIPLAGEGTGGADRGTGVLELTLVGGLLALAVLAFVFGSLLAFVPLLVAAVAILATFLAVGALTMVTTVSVVGEYVVALIGLGVAIDYSLLVVTRWREEIGRGHAGDEAVRRAMASAGRTVAVSAVIVAAGLLSMVVLPVPWLRSFGYAGALIPLVSAAVALTLLPVLLARAGRRLDWPHLRTEASAGRGWAGWARGVIRARWPALVAALAVLGSLAAYAAGLHTGTARADSLATSGPARDGLVALRHAGIPGGALTPIEVLVPAGRDPVPVAAGLDRVPGVRAAVAPGGPRWRRAGTALVTVQPAGEAGTGAGRATVARVRAAVDAGPPGVRVGGVAAQDIDTAEAVYDRFPLLLALVAVATFVLVARAFRSILLAVKAVAVDLLSIAAVLGAVVLVWQHGHGSQPLAGVPGTGAVSVYVPLVVFTFLFGLSMDYEVFLLSRIREEYDRTGSTRTAVIEGTARTGRLITSAALILFLAFATGIGAPQVETKVFFTALAAGILLDATLVRALLVPALVMVLGRWNWWLPPAAARALLLPRRAAQPPPPGDRPDPARVAGGAR